MPVDADRARLGVIDAQFAAMRAKGIAWVPEIKSWPVRLRVDGYNCANPGLNAAAMWT